MLNRGFFERDAVTVARALIGVDLTIDGVGGAIVETEAYDANDPAAHSFRGPTRSNAVLFGPAGHAHIYRIYGLHWCLNFVCGGVADAVLIRAIEPRNGLDVMAQRRGTDNPRLLCSGPGKLCQALGVDHTLDGTPLDAPPFALHAADAPHTIRVGKRIGITKGIDTPWRFGAAESRFLSHPFDPQ